MPEQELQHEAAVAWRDLSKWRALMKKEHLGFLAGMTEEEHVRPDVFRGAREVFVPEYKGLRSPSAWGIQGQLTYLQRATKVAVVTEDPP